MNSQPGTGYLPLQIALDPVACPPEPVAKFPAAAVRLHGGVYIVSAQQLSRLQAQLSYGLISVDEARARMFQDQDVMP